ncbi:sterol desaturase family protein [Tianweitania sp.]|uniref:sterol desaturase family protein n=1 Tax=Tianweitania sp. TaxID=2021634 RepID=UPI00289831C6|nr:sterol desaturase family protein [Tianweitania sp.]
MNIVFGLLISLAVVVLMEFGAYALHRWVMHGWGWGWHKSHHEEHDEHHGPFEKNDLYALVFAVAAVALFALGTWVPLLTWIAIGVTAYGVLYFVFHDGLVHQRWLFKKPPRSGYLKRLYQAHRLHHAVDEKDGAVSFGFLYAPPVAELSKTLGERRKAAKPADHTPL